MRRLLLALSAALLAPQLVQAQGSGLDAHVTQVDSTNYPEVTVYVSVTDASGAPVGGLERADFQLLEDGQPVSIDDFAGGGGGAIHTALVIDRSGSMEDAGKLAGAQDAARVFVGQMRPGDQTALIGFNSTAALIYDFTDARPMLDDGILSLHPDGGTALYDSIVAGVDALREQPGRRALLVLTDGRDCREADNCPDAAGSRHSLQQAIAYARRYDQPVHVIGLGEPFGDEYDGIDESVLRQIAEQTGGQYLHAPEADRLSALYAGLAGSLHEEYRISYQSPRPFYDGTRRQIEVAVGGSAAAGGYVEQHLIDVRSDPRVGLLLLLPILLALLLPSIFSRLRWRKHSPAPAPDPGSSLPGTATAALASAATGTGPAVAATLTAPGALYRRNFCDQCGGALRSGARFCAHCGSQVPAEGDPR